MNAAAIHYQAQSLLLFLNCWKSKRSFPRSLSKIPAYIRAPSAAQLLHREFRFFTYGYQGHYTESTCGGNAANDKRLKSI